MLHLQNRVVIVSTAFFPSKNEVKFLSKILRQDWPWENCLKVCPSVGILFIREYTQLFLKSMSRNRLTDLENKFMVTRVEGNGTPLQYSCQVNPMDGGAWSAAVHGVAKSRTRLSDFHLRAETVLWNTDCSKAPCPQRLSVRMSKLMTWGSDFNASSPWMRWEFSCPFS